jgi:GTP-binding protein
MKYLMNRKQLRRVFLLIDASHGVKDSDRSLMSSLRLAGVPHQVILSKVDRVYLPKGRDITRFDNKAKNSLKPFGSVETISKKMEEVKAEIKPPKGAGALGELLSVSAEVLVGGRKLGIDAVRVAVLQAAGVQFDPKKGKVSVPMMADMPARKASGKRRA